MNTRYRIPVPTFLSTEDEEIFYSRLAKVSQDYRSEGSKTFILPVADHKLERLKSLCEDFNISFKKVEEETLQILFRVDPIPTNNE